MYKLQDVLKYIAQVAGAGVSKQNVVAFTLVITESGPTLLYANNEDQNIVVGVRTGEIAIAVGTWTSDRLPAVKEHDLRKRDATAEEIGSQSKARLKEILSGRAELDKDAELACTALLEGRVVKVSQPRHFDDRQFNGYGFIHAEMLLLDYSLRNAKPPPSGWVLGVSKLLCGYCAIAMEIIRNDLRLDVIAPNAHWLAYWRWRCPPFLEQNVKALVRSLNDMAKRGSPFSRRNSSGAEFIQNDSIFGTEGRCNQNVLVQTFQQQYGGTSPYREPIEDTSDDEIQPTTWVCVTSSCPKYRQVVIPVESDRLLEDLICRICTREVVRSDKLMDF